MMHPKVFSTLLLVTLSVSMPTMAQASTSEQLSHGKKDKVSKIDRKKLSAKDKKEVLTVFKINEKLHAALYSYDQKKVAKLARQLAEAMAKVSNPILAKKLAFSSAKLKEIAAAKERSKIDQNYNLVSMALIHFLKTYDIGSDYDAYSCPMVKKKWVQNSAKTAKVHNPYAPEMPHCGSQDTKLKG